jgi:hypothetical protein
MHNDLLCVRTWDGDILLSFASLTLKHSPPLSSRVDPGFGSAVKDSSSKEMLIAREAGRAIV